MPAHFTQHDHLAFTMMYPNALRACFLFLQTVCMLRSHGFICLSNCLHFSTCVPHQLTLPRLRLLPVLLTSGRSCLHTVARTSPATMPLVKPHSQPLVRPACSTGRPWTNQGAWQCTARSCCPTTRGLKRCVRSSRRCSRRWVTESTQSLHSADKSDCPLFSLVLRGPDRV